MTTAIHHRRDWLVVALNGDITWDSAKEFVDTVDAHLEQYFYLRIEVVVSSRGGMAAAAEHIVCAFERWRRDGVHVRTRVIASAASAAAVLLSVGEERIAGPGATLLYHPSRVFDALVTAHESAELHSRLARIDERFIGFLVDRALRGHDAAPCQAEPSDREVLEHVAAAITLPPASSRRRRRVKQLAERLGRALDEAVRARDRKTLSGAYRALAGLDRFISAPLARTLKLIDRIDEAGDTRGPRPDAQDGLAVAQWRVLYPPSGTVPRWVLTRHLLALGETGSGKSESVVLPLLAALTREPPKRFSGALVIDPKRDLATMLAHVTPQRLEHVTAETLALNVMADERWSIGAHLAAGRWKSAANRILLRAASFLPASPLQVLGPHKVSGGNEEFFNQEGTALLSDVLAFILMLTDADAPPRHDWIDERDEGSLDWVGRLGERAQAHHDGGRGPNALALCAWTISETVLAQHSPPEESWLFERLARSAMRVWGAEPGEGRDLLQRVCEYWRTQAGVDRQHQGVLGSARVACAEFASPQVARSLYFGCEPGWRDAHSSAVDFATLVSREGDGRFVLYQPSRDTLDALVARALKAVFFEAVLAEPARVSGGGRMPVVGYVADEFHRFVTSDAVHGEQSFLDTCRSFGAFCVLATQSTRSIAHALSLGGGEQKTNEAALDIMLTNTATKFFFRTTDSDTANRVTALCPQRPGFPPATAVRPLSLLAPGECYVSLADGRFERRQLDRFMLDEPRSDPPIRHGRSELVHGCEGHALDAISAQPMEFLSEALAVARNIDDADTRAGTLRAIAEAQADAGEFGHALAIARDIEAAYTRAGTLRAITEAQADAGDFKEALASARSIEDAYTRAGTLRAIAEAQADAGDFKEALASARSIEDAYTRAGTLRAIAEAQADAGDFKEALASARSIEDAYTRAGTLRAIAEAQADAGNARGAADTFTEALASARDIEDAYARAGTLRAIAEAQARAGDFEGALAIARNIEDVRIFDEELQEEVVRNSSTETLRAMAEAQADAGDFERALASARSIEAASTRAGTLRAIAEAQVTSDNARGAADIFTEALAGARSIEVAGTRAYSLRFTAEAQARAGDFKAALAIARSIEVAGTRAETLGRIAGAQARAGDFKAALAVARSIEDVCIWHDDGRGDVWEGGHTEVRDEAFKAIAEAQANAGDFKGALASARSIEVAYTRASALRAIAEAQARAGDFKAALAVARSVDDAFTRARTLGAIAEAQARAGDFNGALASARSIEDVSIFDGYAQMYDTEVRDEACKAIARAQVTAGDFNGGAGQRPKHRAGAGPRRDTRHHRRGAGGRWRIQGCPGRRPKRRGRVYPRRDARHHRRGAGARRRFRGGAGQRPKHRSHLPARRDARQIRLGAGNRRRFRGGAGQRPKHRGHLPARPHARRHRRGTGTRRQRSRRGGHLHRGPGQRSKRQDREPVRPGAPRHRLGDGAERRVGQIAADQPVSNAHCTPSTDEETIDFLAHVRGIWRHRGTHLQRPSFGTRGSPSRPRCLSEGAAAGHERSSCGNPGDWGMI